MVKFLFSQLLYPVNFDFYICLRFSPNNLGYTSVFGFNLDSILFNLFCEKIITMITAVPIPECITNTPMVRPTKVRGKNSPYLTVVIVTMAHQKASPKLVILAPKILCLARYTPILPKITMNITKRVGTTIGLCLYESVKAVTLHNQPFSEHV